MANKRYDLLSVRKYKGQDGSEKSAWTNIGSAWEQRDGKGFSLDLHCMPAPDPEKGEYRIVMRVPMPPREDRGAPPARAQSQQSSGGMDGDDQEHGDDDIPF